MKIKINPPKQKQKQKQTPIFVDWSLFKTELISVPHRDKRKWA